jgi:hypothetical protein
MAGALSPLFSGFTSLMSIFYRKLLNIDLIICIPKGVGIGWNSNLYFPPWHPQLMPVVGGPICVESGK